MILKNGNLEIEATAFNASIRKNSDGVFENRISADIDPKGVDMTTLANQIDDELPIQIINNKETQEFTGYAFESIDRYIDDNVNRFSINFIK